jgi:hypothetical protein
MTATDSDPTALPWPYWMLHYVSSDDRAVHDMFLLVCECEDGLAPFRVAA